MGSIVRSIIGRGELGTGEGKRIEAQHEWELEREGKYYWDRGVQWKGALFVRRVHRGGE